MLLTRPANHFLQNLTAPLVFVIAMLGAIVSSGLAVGALVILFGSLSVLYLILTRVLGIEIEPV